MIDGPGGEEFMGAPRPHDQETTDDALEVDDAAASRLHDMDRGRVGRGNDDVHDS